MAGSTSSILTEVDGDGESLPFDVDADHLRDLLFDLVGGVDQHRDVLLEPVERSVT